VRPAAGQGGKNKQGAGACEAVGGAGARGGRPSKQRSLVGPRFKGRCRKATHGLMGAQRKIALKAHPTPPFRKPRAVPLEAGPLCASLSGSLAASFALGSARLDFEATAVVDAD